MSTPKEVEAMIKALNNMNENPLNIKEFYAVHEECMHRDFGVSRIVKDFVEPEFVKLEDHMELANHWISSTNKEIWNRYEGEFEEFRHEYGDIISLYYVHIFFERYIPQDYKDLVTQGRIRFNSRGKLCYLDLSGLYIQVLPTSFGTIKVDWVDCDESDEYDDGFLSLSGNLLTYLPTSFLEIEVCGVLCLNDNLLMLPDNFKDIKVTGWVSLTTEANKKLEDFNGTWEPESEMVKSRKLSPWMQFMSFSELSKSC